MDISRKLELWDTTLDRQAGRFLQGHQPVEFNRTSGYLILTHVTLPLVLTVGSVASEMIGQIALVFSPLSTQAKELSEYSFEISEKSSRITQKALCNIGFVFQKNLFPYTPSHFNDKVRGLNPVLPHIFTTAAALSPLALVYFNYLPKVMLTVPRANLNWLIFSSGQSLFQRFVETEDPHQATNDNLLSHALIKPLCHAVVMRGIQVGLQSLLSNVIRNQAFMFLGFQLSIAGIAVTLILAAINYAQTGNIDYIQSGFNLFYVYGEQLETYGFLTSVYTAVLFDSISCAVAPIISSFAYKPVCDTLFPRVKTLLEHHLGKDIKTSLIVTIKLIPPILKEIPAIISELKNKLASVNNRAGT
jgi:hypothetical protein